MMGDGTDTATTLQAKKIYRWMPRLLAVLCGCLLLMNISALGLAYLESQAVSRMSHDNAIRLAGIESNRFTSKDGAAVWKAIASIREHLATIPKEIPPKWFKQSHDEQQAQIRDILKRLRDLELTKQRF